MSEETMTAEEQLEAALKQEAAQVPVVEVTKGEGKLTYEGKVKSRKGKASDSYRIYLGPQEPNFDDDSEINGFLAEAVKSLTLKKVAQHLYARLCAAGQAATDSNLPKNKAQISVADIPWDKVKKDIEQGTFAGIQTLSDLYERQTKLNAEIGPELEKALEAAEASGDMSQISAVLKRWKEWRKEVQEIARDIAAIKDRAQKRKETKLANARVAQASGVVTVEEEEEEDEEN